VQALRSLDCGEPSAAVEALGAFMKIRLFGLSLVFLIPAVADAKECVYAERQTFLARVVAVDSAKARFLGGERDTAETPSETPLLGPKEIVLAFEQGPHSAYTKYILDILDKHCVKATFFFKGSAALANASAVRDVARRGHTLAAGPWSKPVTFDAVTLEDAKNELEKGLAAVAKAANEPVAPFYRVASRGLTPDFRAYLDERGVSLWRADIESGDTEPGLTPTVFANRTISRVQEGGRGVVSFHDTSKATVDALDSILTNMQIEGFKVVQIVPAANFAPKADVLERLSLPAAASPRVARPTPDQGQREGVRPPSRELPRAAAAPERPQAQRPAAERQDYTRRTGSGDAPSQ